MPVLIVVVVRRETVFVVVPETAVIIVLAALLNRVEAAVDLGIELIGLLRAIQDLIRCQVKLNPVVTLLFLARLIVGLGLLLLRSRFRRAYRLDDPLEALAALIAPVYPRQSALDRHLVLGHELANMQRLRRFGHRCGDD